VRNYFLLRKMIKLFEMFAGYGGASFALKRIGIPFECVGYSEIDKYAKQCYEQNHNLGHKPLDKGNCLNINPNELPDFDLLTGGFPCQSFSIAGKGLGKQDTRGTLFHEIIRIAEVKQPKYMLLENVKGLTNKKHKDTFEKILSELKRIGYDVKWKVMNSKEHGIPQNRERVWFVCKLGSWDFMEFMFPEKEELRILLKDILEEKVEDRYYLSKVIIDRLKLNNKMDFPCYDRKTGIPLDNISSCIRAGEGSGNQKIIGNVNPSGKGMNGNVYGGDIAPTITINKGEGNKIFQLDVSQIRREGQPRVYENVSKCLNTAQGGGHTPLIMNTITEAFGRGGSSSEHINMVKNTTAACGSIRKLTPKECFRLMGFLKDEINLEGLSNTQRYKLAGNGWDINLVSKIFRRMFNSQK